MRFDPTSYPDGNIKDREVAGIKELLTASPNHLELYSLTASATATTMEWPVGGFDPVILNGHYNRPGRDRGRLGSEHMNRQQPMYWQDNHGHLVPAGPAGVGRIGRSASVSDPHRPTQIVIKNEFDAHSPQPSPHRHHRHSSHGHDYHFSDYSDDSFEDRARSPRRHRRRSRRPKSPSRSPSPLYDPEYERKMKKLEDLEKKEQEEEARERFEEEMLLKEAKKAKKKKEEEELKKKAIEEYHIKQLEEKAKKDKEKKEADEEFHKRMKKEFGKAGYDEEDLEKILKRGEKEKEHGGHGKQKKVLDLSRPTYIKVHRKHLSPDTLDEYQLPWEWDEVSRPFIFSSRKPIQGRRTNDP